MKFSKDLLEIVKINALDVVTFSSDCPDDCECDACEGDTEYYPEAN